MKLFQRWPKLLLLAGFAIFLMSCEEEEEQNFLSNEVATLNIIETAGSTSTLGTLVSALTKADENEDSDLIGTLSGEGPFTVFAPTNEAFEDLLSSLDGFDSLDDFDTEEEKALLATILQYHVVAGVAAASGDLSDNQEIETVQSENVTINLDGGVFVEDATDVKAEVITPDVFTTNGVVHVIDKVLLPQAVLNALNDQQDLVDLVIETETLSVLEAAVIKADLVETLKGEGPFTVFAPSDEAFVALLTALGDDFNSLDDFDTEEEIALLRSILLYHVAPGKILAADLAAGEVSTALEGNPLTIIEQDGNFVIGDASDANAAILATDFEATNGVAHIIDKVLLPQEAVDFVAALNAQNIVELAIATDDLSLLVDALVAADAGLVEALSGEGPFTVFAPTNQAFADLLELLGDDYNSLADFDTQEELDLLVKILTYHVISGAEAFSTDLTDGQELTTLNGGTLTIGVNENGVSVKDVTDDRAHVDIPDVDASNGVVHVIDKVLLPQEAVDFVAALNAQNIVELAIATDDLSLLVDALVAADAGLVEALSGEGPFTVFAPTNQAFADLLELLGDDYNSLADFDTQEELDLLVKILTYHVISGAEAFSTDLSDGQQLTTLNGGTLTIGVNENGVSVKDVTDDRAHVDIPDVDASNGVVHIIDKVLLPQEAVDFVTALNTKSIVELAQSVDNLSILVEALIQADAGLVETLSGEGPFTVFAPDNQSFEDLFNFLGDDYNTIADFDTPAEKELLTTILTYHVVAGQAFFKSDLNTINELTTVQGGTIGVNIRDNGVINLEDKSGDHTQVTAEDTEASNGVVHIVNQVLLPQEAMDFVDALNTPNIVELAQSVDNLSILVEALVQADAGLVETLSGDGPFTVFAPDNQSFQDLFNLLGDDFNSIADFDTPAEKELLTKVLTYHVVAGQAFFKNDFNSTNQLTTVQGETIGVNIRNNGVINLEDKSGDHTQVTAEDTEARNGVVHIVNKVLLPQEVIDAL